MNTMNKKDKNRTVRTKTTGSSDYKGYYSKNVSNDYDSISDSLKDKASDLGGVLDNSTDKYHGNRYCFSSKESRDDFNQELEKQRKNKKKQTNENKISKILREEIIRELNHLTYDSARIKAKERGDKKRAKAFAMARNQAFTRDFGKTKPIENGNGFSIRMLGDDEPYLSMSQNTRPRYGRDRYETFNLDGKNPNLPYAHSTGEIDGWETCNNCYSHSNKPSAEGNKEYARAMAKADNEFRDYLEGKNEYKKGIGYVKKNGKPQGASIENPDGTPNVGSKPNNKDFHEYLYNN